VRRESLPIIQDAEGRPAPVEGRFRKPKWLEIRPPGGPRYAALEHRARRLSLATVCEEARCPNLAECWASGTATFMLMGEVCTRGCRFCAVHTAKAPPPLDPDEPSHIAEAVAEMGLSYVVLTSVNRDDLENGGAEHLARCIQAVARRSPDVLLEMLMPDFEGNGVAIDTLARTPLAVLAHNIETVERLTPEVRDPRAAYRQSLAVLERVKATDPNLITKSSIMLGLGETEAEVVAAMRDLLDVGVEIVTLGQYLQPTPRHLPVVEYVHPSTFDRFAVMAKEIGFEFVASGPLVRSSYRAGELYVEGRLAEEHRGRDRGGARGEPEHGRQDQR
jgi:lipoic acid synthetase